MTERLGGLCGVLLFFWWLDGPAATLRGIAAHLNALADEVESPAPKLLSAKQVGALLALFALEDR